LQNLAALTDSAVIPLALLRGRLTLEAAFEAAQLEALHQAARWGEDPEAAARRRALKSEMETALRFLMLLA